MAKESISCAKNNGGAITVARCRKERDEEKCKRAGCPLFFNAKIREVFQPIMLKPESVYCRSWAENISVEHCLMIQAGGGADLYAMCKGCVEPYRLCIGCGKSKRQVGTAFDAETGLCLSCSFKEAPAAVSVPSESVSADANAATNVVEDAPAATSLATVLVEEEETSEHMVTPQTERVPDIPIEQVEGITPKEAERLREKGNITTLREFLAASLETVQGCMMGRQVPHITKVWQGLQEGLEKEDIAADSPKSKEQPAAVPARQTPGREGEYPTWEDVEDVSPKTKRYLSYLGILGEEDLEQWTEEALRAKGVYGATINLLAGVLKGRGKAFKPETAPQAQPEVVQTSVGLPDDAEVKARLRNIEEIARKQLEEAKRTNFLLVSILEKLAGGRKFLLMPLDGEPAPAKVEGAEDEKEG